MSEDSIAVKEQVQATGTWTRDETVVASVFASASYRAPNGKRIETPVEVAGDNITGQVVRQQPAK
jgi:hypothetical protein